MADVIQSLAGCTKEEAEAALATHGDIVAAVDALLVKPVVKGDTLIPPKPVIDNGLTPEQDSMCRRGRWLQDQVNAVFSVAHSKSLPDPPAPAAVADLSAPPSSPTSQPPVPESTTAPPQDAPEQSFPRFLQSETPL
jgi:hypothetical protein